jgi:type II secretory pathway component PulJ
MHSSTKGIGFIRLNAYFFSTTGSMTFFSRYDIHGVTLVELCVSLLLGTILVGATVSSIMSTQKTNQLVEAQMQLQQNSLFALSLIGKSIQQAGYRPHKNMGQIEMNESFHHPSTTADERYMTQCNFESKEIIKGIGALGDTPDILCIRYFGNNDGLTRDCGEQVALGNTEVIERYSLERENSVLNSWKLVCAVSRIEEGVLSDDNQYYDIIEGVDHLKFLYGIYHANEKSVTEYIPYSDSIPSQTWQNVRAARIYLTINSITNIHRHPQDSTVSYLDAQKRTFNDQKLHKNFSETTLLRNITQ